MIGAKRPDRRPAKLLTVDADGGMRQLPRVALASLFGSGDLVIANDAATLPASLKGIHCTSGEPIEVRLAAWVSIRDPTRFAAIAFGAGDHRTRTEDRMSPPALLPDDRLTLGPLVGIVERLLDDPRLFRLRFLGDRATVLAGLARHGRPIQYAHVPEPLALWDVWTPIAADPIAFEPPSAGFALDWHTQAVWRQRGIGFATLTHAAGISSTGRPLLDLRLPFDEPYRIPAHIVAAIKRAKSKDRRIIAIGTSVVRALESAANADGNVRAGEGVANGRIVRETPLRVVDAILTGVHQPGESHFELLRAFASDSLLDQISEALDRHGYRPHEFGDSILIERCCRSARHHPTTNDPRYCRDDKQMAQGGGEDFTNVQMVDKRARWSSVLRWDRCRIRGGAEDDPEIQRWAAPFQRGTDGSDRHVNTGDNTMTERRPKIAALVADAFQEEEYFLPKIALNEAGYQVEVVSSRKEPVEIYSYFARTGLLDVERTIMEARPEDYVGILIPGGAKSPALLAEDPRVTKFVQDVSARGGVIACICRGSMLAARSKVVAGRRMTGFNDSVSYPELVVQPDAEAAGATWVQDVPVVVDHNLVTSPHPRHSAVFSAAIVEVLRGK